MLRSVVVPTLVDFATELLTGVVEREERVETDVHSSRVFSHATRLHQHLGILDTLVVNDQNGHGEEIGEGELVARDHAAVEPAALNIRLGHVGATAAENLLTEGRHLSLGLESVHRLDVAEDFLADGVNFLVLLHSDFICGGEVALVHLSKVVHDGESDKHEEGQFPAVDEADDCAGDHGGNCAYHGTQFRTHSSDHT